MRMCVFELEIFDERLADFCDLPNIGHDSKTSKQFFMLRISCLKEAVDEYKNRVKLKQEEILKTVLVGRVVARDKAKFLVFADQSMDIPCLFVNPNITAFNGKIMLTKWAIYPNLGCNLCIHIEHIIGSDKLDELCSYHLCLQDLQYFKKYSRKREIIRELTDDLSFGEIELGKYTFPCTFYLMERYPNFKISINI